MRTFQSPFHRGFHCISCWHQVISWEASSFQSPFHRGFHCIGNRDCGGTLTYEAFSPLFIGDSIASKDCSRPFVGIAHSFSPLFIGDSIASTSVRHVEPQHVPFQSPFHRGFHCIWKESLEKNNLPKLSVPFSSGIPLHPVTAEALTTVLSVLSVPFSSGIPLHPAHLVAKVCQDVAFSPLFIGDSIASGSRCPAHYFCHRPFSPLFIGDSIASRGARPNAGTAAGLSVPFSSGIPLHPCVALPGSSGFPGLSVPFSSGIPLHRKR